MSQAGGSIRHGLDQVYQLLAPRATSIASSRARSRPTCWCKCQTKNAAIISCQGSGPRRAGDGAGRADEEIESAGLLHLSGRGHGTKELRCKRCSTSAVAGLKQTSMLHCGNACFCRVGPGNFTPSPSQIRT